MDMGMMPPGGMPGMDIRYDAPGGMPGMDMGMMPLAGCREWIWG